MTLTQAPRRIWRTYLAVNVVFATLNGVYASYAFLYLKRALESSGSTSTSILDNLLFIIVASMVFEFFAEPITGDWADTHGRRRVIVGTFGGVSLAFLTYWLISGAAAYSASPERTIVMLSLLAELFFAVSAALFNGALDAWFVDELRLARGPTGAALLPLFARQRRWAGVSMVGAGVLSLWLASAALRDPGAHTDGLTATTALPWLVATGVATLTAIWIKFRLVEHWTPAAIHEPPHWRIWLRLRRTLRVRELRNALVISSVLYTGWICFMYLLPVLMTDPKIVAEAGVFEGVLANYYWYYLAMGTTRFLGPYLSSVLRRTDTQIGRFQWWGVLNCGALSLAGVALLVRGAGDKLVGTQLDAVLVPAALVLFWVTKLAEEAFKPVRSTYLNHLVIDSSDRAFVLSMATPFGAVIILIGTAVLGALQYWVSLHEVRVSVPLLFAILGTLGVAVTLQLSRRVHQFQ